MQYSLRFLITALGVLVLGLVLRRLFDLDLAQALLVATPACLMLGSMAVLFDLARRGEAVDAKSQLVTLLVVEFLLVPLGAAAALVAFFVIR